MRNEEAKVILLVAWCNNGMFSRFTTKCIKVMDAHLTAESEERVGDLGDVLLLPEVDGLEHVDVGHAVRF